MGTGQLDATTLLVGLAVIFFAVSLAQLVLLGISWLIRRRRKRATDLSTTGATHDDLL